MVVIEALKGVRFVARCAFNEEMRNAPNERGALPIIIIFVNTDVAVKKLDMRWNK